MLKRISRNSTFAVSLLIFLMGTIKATGQQIVGINVTPHSLSSELQWRRRPNASLSAKCELVIKNDTKAPLKLSAKATRFDGKSSDELLANDHWAWHDTPGSWLTNDVELPPEFLTVFTVNGRSSDWGVDTNHELTLDGDTKLSFQVANPQAWMSAVTFLSVDGEGRLSDKIRPNQIVVHIQNTGSDFTLTELRVWLPPTGGSQHLYQLAHRFSMLTSFPSDGVFSANSKGGFLVNCDPLPLTYCVLELRVRSMDSKVTKSMWAHLRIKREVFDISGGWVASNVNGRNSLTFDEYLKTLKRMHINTGQIQEVGGYTDNSEQYAEHPLKRFNRMWPIERYNSDKMISQIHAVEFLGEPQYGGGRPVPPQEVWGKLAPYALSRLATSVTLSEERTWRYYAGLSDYPHYDAYRVIAPAADSWRAYDRWKGERIRWGAPLETIGVMTRSLRDLSRPRPIAYWSQGAHDGWGGRRSLRRGSPNADELRSQAWHGLANRITSLYWFNLSLKSLVKFPDLIEPITRVNREIRMLHEVFLRGDAYDYQRLKSDDGPDWDLNSIVTADTALFVAHDLQYRIDAKVNEFKSICVTPGLHSKYRIGFLVISTCFELTRTALTMCNTE